MSRSKTNRISLPDGEVWKRVSDAIYTNWNLWINSAWCATNCTWQLRFNHRTTHKMLKFLRTKGFRIVTDGNSQFYKVI